MPPTTPTDPSNTLNAALDIGTLSSTSFSDFIGSVDRNDFYHFTLANNSNFKLSLNGLKDDAKAELISDSDGNVSMKLHCSSLRPPRLSIGSAQLLEGNVFFSAQTDFEWCRHPMPLC